MATTEDGSSTVTQVTTPAEGKITIQGLKAGTYYLHEVTAPQGYNKLSAPVKVEIVPDATDGAAKITYKVNDAVPEATIASGTVPVENKSGTLLPTTGGMGTVIFTIVGVAIILIGVIWFVRRNRKKATAEE